MSTSPTVPMISPDGQIGDVPQERAPDAVKAGFKLGQDMLSPDGKQGVIPFDHVHDAIGKGFTLAGAPPKKPPQPAMEDEEAEMREVSERDAAEYAKAAPLMAGGGLAEEGAEAAEGLMPFLRRVGQKLMSLGSKGKAPAEAMEPAVEAAASAAEPETAAAAEQPASFGENEDLSGDDPAKQIVRLTGDNGEVYDVPQSELDEMEAFKGQSPPLSAEAKAKISKQVEGKYQPAIAKRGANKGQPKTYRVWDGKQWKTLPKYEPTAAGRKAAAASESE